MDGEEIEEAVNALVAAKKRVDLTSVDGPYKRALLFRYKYSARAQDGPQEMERI